MVKKVGKERLTITLRKDILESLDRFIDGDKIRNRSHAIEFILSRYLGAGINTCVILAAGKNEEISSPLLRVNNRPIIAYTIELLRQAGITNIIMVVSASQPDVQHYLGDGSQWKVNITYVIDKEGKGTAPSLHLAREYVNDTFLLMYGDILADIDLQELVRFHKEQDNIHATLAVTACTNPSLYGVTELQGSRVFGIIEKPVKHDRTDLVFSGISVCQPSLFDFIDGKPDKDIVRDVLPDLAHRGQIGGYPFSGKWFDVSHPEEFERAQREWVTKPE